MVPAAPHPTVAPAAPSPPDTDDTLVCAATAMPDPGRAFRRTAGRRPGPRMEGTAACRIPPRRARRSSRSAPRGGFLPAPVVIPTTPVGYEYNRRSIIVLNVFDKGALPGAGGTGRRHRRLLPVPAGSTLILYNDAPAPVPAFDPRIRLLHGRSGPERDRQQHRRRAHDPGRLRPQHPDHHAVPGVGRHRHAPLQPGRPCRRPCRPPTPGIFAGQPTHRAGVGLWRRLRHHLHRTTTRRIQDTSMTFTAVGTGHCADDDARCWPKAIQELFRRSTTAA